MVFAHGVSGEKATMISTDNRTTELLKDLLLELMDEYAMDDFTSQTKFAEKYAECIEQAIAATLGAGECK